MENYRQHHDIGFYAESLHISTTYLSRIVKHITGHTVRFHISELLCADARKLLECTNLDIKEIAEKLGFSDQSVFGKFFVKKTGLSPMKFRTQRERDKKNYPFPDAEFVSPSTVIMIYHQTAYTSIDRNIFSIDK